MFVGRNCFSVTSLVVKCLLQREKTIIENHELTSFTIKNVFIRSNITLNMSIVGIVKC